MAWRQWPGLDKCIMSTNMKQVETLIGGLTVDNGVLLKQLAHAKLKSEFGRWLRGNGFHDSAAEDLAARAVNSGAFAISDQGSISGDDPISWLDNLKRKGLDPHLFQLVDPAQLEKEKVQFYGYSRAEFAALPAIDRLSLANREIAKQRQEAKRKKS